MIESRANNCQALQERRALADASRMPANRRQECLRSHADTFDKASNRRITFDEGFMTGKHDCR